jgi:RNA polymerase sigma factor for flagellar operon FliA
MELAENHLSRNQLILEYLPHVKRIVHRIAIHLPSHVIEIDDLINAGIIGLIAALDRYDPTKDNKFMTYALFRIRGAVLSELRSRDFLSRSNRRKVRELEKTSLELEQRFGREAKDEEIAKELGINLEQLHKVRKMSTISFISLEGIGFNSKEDKKKLMSCLVNRETDDALTLAKLKEIENTIARTIEQLPEKVKLVISLYYWEEMTMKEIGKALDITESRVSQIHSQAIIHLKKKLIKEGLVDVY